uniref:SGNH hydrolase-type esterase domain-containing protein n=1 Tax=Myripristis murdjan TaxID=586833 RepID=A0A667WYL5_9TELE
MAPRTPPPTTIPCENCQKAERSITHLKEDIRRLSDELWKKDSLLSDCIDTAAAQSKVISTMNSAFADTIHWDPASSPCLTRPSSCSTPSSQAPWSGVVRKGLSGRSRIASPPSLNLSNRFSTLQPDVSAHPADVPAVDAVPVADSIVRNVRFANAITHCFPGSELMKADFIRLVNLLTSSGKTAFISGPIPTLGRGAGRFSRILSLHTWLQSVCTEHKITYIHNFDLFWERSSMFARDGLHLNTLGNRMLVANIQHAIQHTRK